MNFREKHREPKEQRAAPLHLNAITNFLLRYRMAMLLLGHTIIFIAAYTVAMSLRFDFSIPPEYLKTFWKSLPFLLITKLTVFTLLRSYNGWWRYVTFNDLVDIGRATIASSVCFALVDYFVLPYQVPRAVILIDLVATGLLLSLVRSSWRLLREGMWPRIKLPDGYTGALMISNHHETMMLAHQINSFHAHRHRVVGLLSEGHSSIGESRAGIPIVGHTEDAINAAARCGASEIWVVAGSISGERLRQLKDLIESSSLDIKIIPPVLGETTKNGQIPIREIDIRDLLQREPVELDMESIRNEITGRPVLVTGAGGSIGSEICRQLLQFQPSDMILVDHRENSVFLIHNELDKSRPMATRLQPCVGDILDHERMVALFNKYRPELVYHAAAHKHVGLMELNTSEAVKNNILGTKTVADLSRQFNVRKFVHISTDKAVNPTSVMGATKQIAERYVHALAQDSNTAFVVVRFGNVLGSNGSVVPIFTNQIAQGGPITITDRRMTRFFMTIPEASQLVLQAASMGRGGEVFVLKMGEQVSILQLAKEMIRLAGLPTGAIEIQLVGMRPGEKLFEELYFDSEERLDTDHPKIQAAYHRPCNLYEIQSIIDSLHNISNLSNAEIRDKLATAVPEFTWNPGTGPVLS